MAMVTLKRGASLLLICSVLLLTNILETEARCASGSPVTSKSPASSPLYVMDKSARQGVAVSKNNRNSRRVRGAADFNGFSDPIAQFLTKLQLRKQIPDDLQEKIRSNYSIILETQPQISRHHHQKSLDNSAGSARSVTPFHHPFAKIIPKQLTGILVGLSNRQQTAHRQIFGKVKSWFSKALSIGAGSSLGNDPSFSEKASSILLNEPLSDLSDRIEPASLLSHERTLFEPNSDELEKRKFENISDEVFNIDKPSIEPEAYKQYQTYTKSENLAPNTPHNYSIVEPDFLSNHNVNQEPLTLYNIPNMVPTNYFAGKSAEEQSTTSRVMHEAIFGPEGERPISDWMSNRVRNQRTANFNSSAHVTGDQAPSAGDKNARSLHNVFSQPRAERWTDSLSWIHRVPVQMLGNNSNNISIVRQYSTNVKSFDNVNRNEEIDEDASVNSTLMPASLMSPDLSELIWSDLTRSRTNSEKNTEQDLSRDRLSLIADISTIGSQLLDQPSSTMKYHSIAPSYSAPGEFANSSSGSQLSHRLLHLHNRLGEMPAEDAIELLVRAGSRLIDHQMAAASSARKEDVHSLYAAAAGNRDGNRRHSSEAPLCRCPSSAVTPGVLAGLTSLLALLIYVASVATLALSGSGVGFSSSTNTATSSANATGRAFALQSDDTIYLSDISKFWRQKSITFSYGGYSLTIRNVSLLIDKLSMLLQNLLASQHHNGRSYNSGAFSRQSWRTAAIYPFSNPAFTRLLGPKNRARRSIPSLDQLIEKEGVLINVQKPNSNDLPSSTDLSWSNMFHDFVHRNTVKAISAPVTVATAQYNVSNSSNRLNFAKAIPNELAANSPSKSTSQHAKNYSLHHRTGIPSHTSITEPNSLKRPYFVKRPNPTRPRRPTPDRKWFHSLLPAGRRNRVKSHNCRKLPRKQSARNLVKSLVQRLFGAAKRNFNMLDYGNHLVAITRKIAPGVIRLWNNNEQKYQSRSNGRLGPRHLTGTGSWQKQADSAASHSTQLKSQKRFRHRSGLKKNQPSNKRPSGNKVTLIFNKAANWLGKAKTNILRKFPSIAKNGVHQDNAVRLKHQLAGLTDTPAIDELILNNNGVQSASDPSNTAQNKWKTVKQHSHPSPPTVRSSHRQVRAKYSSQKTAPPKAAKYKKIMCDCKSNLADILGFLPLAILVGYSTTVSTAAASAAVSGSGGSAAGTAAAGSVTVTINDADTTTIANTNSPSLSNTDNDVITVAANANPVNTNTNTLTNNDNDVISNTNTATTGRAWARSLAADPLLGLLYDILRLKDTAGGDSCFHRQLCAAVVKAGINKSVLSAASIPIALLVRSHRGGTVSTYQQVMLNASSDRCALYKCPDM